MTYKELLAQVRADNPNMSYREAQAEASRLSKLPLEEVVEKVPETKKATAAPKVAPTAKIDVFRCNLLEKEIRSREVTVKRILHVLAGNGHIGITVNKTEDGVFVTAPGMRIPVRGVFEIK